MTRVAALLILALSLAGCDAINTLIEGFKHAHEVETDLEASTGMKPQVGFDWTNGRLARVTVTFPRIDDKRPIGEFAETVRRAVGRHFRQTPRDIVLGFSLGKSPDTVALHSELD
jgi:hypothetical protein